ncbi:MAG: hypothetical protein ACFFKA_14250 [Candidatus Thorarchaeota archaeon]
MSSTHPPKIVKIIQEQGEIDDELDYALMSYLLKNRGEGFTACQPKLAEIDGGKTAIIMDIDNTFINKSNQLMGLGIVGNIYIDFDTLKVIYCTPIEDLISNIEKLKQHGILPQERPRGKY